MTTFCISCPQELPEAHSQAAEHFKQFGVEAQFVNGIHAETFGILAWRPYTRDDPKGGFLIRMAQVGLCLSHYMIWNICLHHGDEIFFILESDAEFSDGWENRISNSMNDAPPDWDIILVGSCNTSDKPKTHIKGDVWEIKWPFTTHAYLVREKALQILIESCRDAAQHIDIALIDKSYPKLKVYTVIPRICGQRGRELEP